MRPEEIPMTFVFEDESIVVVDKPAGMLVHPTHRDKNGTLLNALTHYLNVSPRRGGDAETLISVVRPGLVHRLDRETSGVIVVAKTIDVHRKLAREFMKKRVEKRYVAVVDGALESDGGVIEAPIGRFAEKKYWGVKADGKTSTTRYRVRQRFDDSTLIELEPITGRTNQLRIHCSSIGHPIVGDVRRGGRPYRRLCLHAWQLSLKHPISGEMLRLEAPMPNDFLHQS